MKRVSVPRAMDRMWGVMTREQKRQLTKLYLQMYRAPAIPLWLVFRHRRIMRELSR
jgi:hypothetical protein